MEEGVYVYKFNNSECNQLRFAEVRRSGMIYEEKPFQLRRYVLLLLILS